MVIWCKEKHRHDKKISDSSFPITFLRVGNTACVNGPVISLTKGASVHPSLIGNDLVTRYGFPEGSCVITKKGVYADDETWAKVVKVVAPGIRKFKARDFTFLFFLFYSLHI